MDHSWRSRHAATSPMFVDSLHPAHSLAKQTQVVKATQQNLQFTETVAGVYLWTCTNNVICREQNTIEICIGNELDFLENVTTILTD